MAVNTCNPIQSSFCQNTDPTPSTQAIYSFSSIATMNSSVTVNGSQRKKLKKGNKPFSANKLGQKCRNCKRRSRIPKTRHQDNTSQLKKFWIQGRLPV